MSIVSVQKRAAVIGSGATELGRVFMGEPKDDKGRAGKGLPHFRVEFNDAHKHLEDPFRQQYGEKPQTLGPVMLMGATPDEVAPAWMDQFGGGRLVRRCDGEQIHREWTKENGVNRELQPCKAPACDCKPIVRIKFILPEFMWSAGAYGHFLLLTTSINAIDDMYAYLSDAHRIGGVPLSALDFEFYKEITFIDRAKPDGNPGETIKQPHPLVKIRAVQSSVRALAQGLVERAAALPAQIEDDEPPPPIDMETGEINPEPPAPAIWEQLAKVGTSIFNSPEEQDRVLAYAGQLNLPFGAKQSKEVQLAMLMAVQAIIGSEADQSWTSDTKTAAKFFAAAQKDFGMNVQQVNDALDTVASYEVIGLDDWRGSKAAAWAALLYRETEPAEFDDIPNAANRAAVVVYALSQVEAGE